MSANVMRNSVLLARRAGKAKDGSGWRDVDDAARDGERQSKQASCAKKSTVKSMKASLGTK